MQGKKKDDGDAFARLVRDLEAKKTLCRAKDYPNVSLEQLNEYVKNHGPIFHPNLGEQRGFSLDEGRFVPFRSEVFGRCVVRPYICHKLLDWVAWSGRGGLVMNALGGFVLDGTTLRVPDVAYVPRNRARQLTEAQPWTRDGQLFAPTFVVEIDTLAGPNSNLRALDRKMRREYFPHGVQLGWLIDPKNKIMYEYKRDHLGVRCVDNKSWRDLDGGAVLPGLILACGDLDKVLEEDSGLSAEDEAEADEEETEKELDLACPYQGCGQRFSAPGAFATHAMWHSDQSAQQRCRAKH